MSALFNSCQFLLLISYVSTLIIPEELPSLLSVIYSNIPPIMKGTDSRVGVGFRLGEHADFQVLLELGPQNRTQPLGPETDNKKRRQVQRPTLVVLPATGTDNVADTPGGKWLSSWRSALINQQPAKYSKFSATEQQVFLNPMEGKEHIATHLQQLYNRGSKQTEDISSNSSNNDIETVSNKTEGIENSTSIETQTSDPPSFERKVQPSN